MAIQTCDQCLEILWNDGSLSGVIADQYWNGGVDTDALFEFMIKCAQGDGIILSDVNVWDYDTALYAAYQSDSDKGLS